MRYLRIFAVLIGLLCLTSFSFLHLTGSDMEERVSSSSIAYAAEYLSDAPLRTIQPDQYLFDLPIIAAFHLILLFLFHARRAIPHREKHIQIDNQELALLALANDTLGDLTHRLHAKGKAKIIHLERR